MIIKFTERDWRYKNENIGYYKFEEFIEKFPIYKSLLTVDTPVLDKMTIEVESDVYIIEVYKKDEL